MSPEERALREAMAVEARDAAKPTLDQLDAFHKNDAPGGALPVTWTDGHTGHKMRGRPLTVLPTVEEIDAFGSPRAATCGQCKDYDLEGGRKEIRRQRVLERVVLEDEWKLHHMGEVQSLGVCKQRPNMAVSYISKACEYIRLRSMK